MTDTPSPDEKHVALLAKVQSYVEDESAAIEAEARERARAIVADQHATARARVHHEIGRIRRESAVEIEKQSARIHTARRHDLYDQENKYLNTVWPQLDQALQERWGNADTRHDWLGMVICAAVERLHGGAWLIEHPEGWSPDELDPFTDEIHAVPNVEVTFQANADLRAGLRIHANGAMLDGTLKGLTLDRRTISAVFLAEIFTLAEDAS